MNKLAKRWQKQQADRTIYKLKDTAPEKILRGGNFFDND